MNNKFDFTLCEKSSKLHSNQLDKNKNSYQATNNFYSIIMPPPNLTGILHIGHAWNGTVQDFLIRYQSLKQNNPIWFAGTDHAGIATQTKYESYLKKENKYSDFLKLSRKEKIDSLYKWAKNNNNEIVSQWKEMGFFLDYENERFTLDDEASKFVIKTFVDLYNKKLIYRGKKIVNWDVKLNTAISNIEVIKENTKRKMYYIKYFLENSDDYLTIATTRPETIFVDVAVFINPKNNKYKKYLNKNVINPITKKPIPILSDNYIDDDFGTGVMKCTPAHDFNDYDLGKKYNLEIISCIDYNGKMNENAGEYIGIDRFECQSKIINFFKKNNLLVKEELIDSVSNISERSGEIIEPLISEQWFINMNPFAKKIIELQSSKNKINIYPQKFEKILINWVKEMDDWCISRQLWWGHQLPVWYNKKTNEIYVDTLPPKDIENWIQDNDVLDTWFSSGLWPLIVTKENKKFFPTNVLVTAYDIIFFWVVRMISFSLEIENQKPFNDVFITGLIRDEFGKKMSKSLGNGIDPKVVIKEKGVDSLRLTLLSNSSPGEDIRFSQKKIDMSWSFLNKLWNVFRYINIYNVDYIDKIDLNNIKNIDIWIINKFFNEYNSIINNFEKYNILVGVNKIINFIKNDFASIYLELNKNRILTKDKNLIYILFYLLKNLLILLHPTCPYITEYLYEKLPNKTKKSIIFESINFKNIINSKEKIINNLLLIIEYVRKVRFENKLSKKDKFIIELYPKNNNEYSTNMDEIISILSTENIEISLKENLVDANSNDYIVFSEFFIKVLNNTRDDSKIIDDINKEIEFVKKELERLDSILSNKNFLLKAPKDKVELELKKKEMYNNKLIELQNQLKNF